MLTVPYAKSQPGIKFNASSPPPTRARISAGAVLVCGGIGARLLAPHPLPEQDGVITGPDVGGGQVAAAGLHRSRRVTCRRSATGTVNLLEKYDS